MKSHRRKFHGFASPLLRAVKFYGGVSETALQAVFKSFSILSRSGNHPPPHTGPTGAFPVGMGSAQPGMHHGLFNLERIISTNNRIECGSVRRGESFEF